MFLLCRNKVCKVNSEDIVFNSGTHRKKLPVTRSEEHTSELQSLRHLVCRLLLEKKNSVKLLDEGSRQDITQFANASASARRRDTKTITVTSAGEGQREMVVSYTIAAPIWKTIYS